MRTCALSELFEITYGNGLELVKLPKDSAGVNFVARTQKNNGIVAKVRKQIVEPPFHKGQITVAVSGSVMESFLQPEDFYTAFHVMVLRSKIEMTDEIKLFYCHCLRMNKFKYSYGRQANITLPTLQVPCLDEAVRFIGDFSVSKLRKSMTERLNVSALKVKSNNTSSEIKNVPLSTIFKLKNGTASSGIQRINYRRNNNWIPYIRPSYKQSTSIDAYVNKNMFSQDEIYPAETLYVSTNGQGSHTYSYVSVEEFVPNSDVAVLIPRESMTLREKLFYAMCISHNRFKFSYGRKPKGEKLGNILVPNQMNKDFNALNIDKLLQTMADF